VTDSDALFNEAIEKIEDHTDARSAALLLDGDGVYTATRSFGTSVALKVSENDGAILALKTWHAPLDPHRYSTALQGALALPMVSRGRLLGVLLLGERVGGEAYAPDEVEALSQFAHRVGSAIDALSTSHTDSIVALRESMASMAASIGNAMRALEGSIAAELRDRR
jgi:GAF domain-containing protein